MKAISPRAQHFRGQQKPRRQRVRHSASGFNPVTISTLRGWYDFSDTATLFQDTALTTPITADAQVILGMTDKSGQANTVTEATNGPTYKANIQNGLSVGRYDGVNDVLTTAANPTWPTGAAELTVFMVVDVANAGVFAQNNNVVDGWVLRSQSTTAARFTTVGVFDYDLAAVHSTNWGIVAFVLDASVDATWWAGGGTAVGTVAGATFATAAAGRTGKVGNAANADIGDLLIFTGDLHASDLSSFNSVGSYLGSKWNLSWSAVS